MSHTFDQIVEEEKAFHRASLALDDMPSCTNFFDKWASCFALVPQIKSVYRYGTGQDCKDKLDDFKFCLTMKGMSQEERYEAWIHRKAQKSAAKRLSPESSENVWEIRRYIGRPEDANVIRTFHRQLNGQLAAAPASKPRQANKDSLQRQKTHRRPLKQPKNPMP